MSSAVCSAIMPLDALHRASTIAMITTVSEPDVACWVVDLTACVMTCAALWGRDLSRPTTRRCTVRLPILTSEATPSSAISAGNRARNQL